MKELFNMFSLPLRVEVLKKIKEKDFESDINALVSPSRYQTSDYHSINTTTDYINTLVGKEEKSAFIQILHLKIIPSASLQQINLLFV